MMENDDELERGAREPVVDESTELDLQFLDVALAGLPTLDALFPLPDFDWTEFDAGMAAADAALDEMLAGIEPDLEGDGHGP